MAVSRKMIVDYICASLGTTNVVLLEEFETVNARHICPGSREIVLLGREQFPIDLPDGSGRLVAELYLCRRCGKLMINKNTLSAVGNPNYNMYQNNQMGYNNAVASGMQMGYNAGVQRGVQQGMQEGYFDAGYNVGYEQAMMEAMNNDMGYPNDMSYPDNMGYNEGMGYNNGLPYDPNDPFGFGNGGMGGMGGTPGAW